MQISLSQGLKIMEQKDEMGNPTPFSIVFCTADRKKNTGGEIITLDNIVLSRNQKVKDASKTGKKKSQNHYANFTRNIKILSSGAIRKVHGHLIDSINGNKIYW
jgi:hypothetical protein